MFIFSSSERVARKGRNHKVSQKNGGDNTFSIVNENCHDKDPSVPIGVKTKLRLTHSGHSISQIEKGFINMTVEFKVRMREAINNGSFITYNNMDVNTIDSSSPSKELNYIFIGFKDAVEIIDELFFWVDGKLVDNYHQQDMVRESFAYNCIRPRDHKAASPHSHSLWENVMNMSPNVAGVYVPLEKFQKKKNTDQPPTVDVKMNLIIPFTDQLALQAWRLYPNRILGEFEEEIRTTLNGLVWCQVPPHLVGEIKRFWEFDNTKEYNAPILPITNHFTQIGQPAIIVGKIEQTEIGATHNGQSDLDLTGGELKQHIYTCESSINTQTALTRQEAGHASNTHTIKYNAHNVITYTLQVNTLEYEKNGAMITKCQTNCAGFGIKDVVMNGIWDSLNQPVIIPSQELTRHTFESRASKSGYNNLIKSVPLRNATNITMMFPQHDGDCTVYKNIMYENVRLTVNKKVYPETEFENTWDGRFIQYQLQANELDGDIEPTKEFMESISRPLQKVENYGPPLFERGKRFLMCPFDNTSFGINFQLERGNAGYVFDGIDTGSQAVNIEFKGTPLVQGNDDPYIYPNMQVNNGAPISVNNAYTNQCFPEMWICSDTYWTWSIQDGVKYYPRGIPTDYE